MTACRPTTRVAGSYSGCGCATSGVGVSGLVAIGLSYARTPIAIAAAEIAVAFAIGVAFNGAGAVQAIADAHRALLHPSPSEEAINPV